MLQRVQTLYLLGTLIFLSLMIFFPVAELFAGSEQSYKFVIQGIVDTNSSNIAVNTLPVSVLIGLTSLISLISIIVFKNRTLQMRLSVFNIILMIGLLGMEYFYADFISAEHLKADVHYTIYSIIPVPTIILTFLAYKAIKKDDNLIKSVDRIR